MIQDSYKLFGPKLLLCLILEALVYVLESMITEGIFEMISWYSYLSEAIEYFVCQHCILTE